MEEVISFKNKFNNQLVGIMHEPDGDKFIGEKVGINLLNPGLKNRVAPHRLNVKIARKLCKLGYYVLRSDPHGIGDSEGKFMGSNEPIMDLWGEIQRGSFVDDTISANNILCSSHGIKKVILIGQCGAVVTAGIVGSIDRRVDRLILINTPTTLLSSKLDIIDLRLVNKSTKQLINEYLNDFRRLDWVKKILSGGVNIEYLKNKILIFKKNIISRHQRHVSRRNMLNNNPDRFHSFFRLEIQAVASFQRLQQQPPGPGVLPWQ